MNNYSGGINPYSLVFGMFVFLLFQRCVWQSWSMHIHGSLQLTPNNKLISTPNLLITM